MLSLSVTRSRISAIQMSIFWLAFLGIGSSIANGKAASAIRSDISARNITERQAAIVNVNTWDLPGYNGGLTYNNIDCYNGGYGDACWGAISNAAAAAAIALPQYANGAAYGAYGILPGIEAGDESGIYVTLVYEILDSGNLYNFGQVAQYLDPGTNSEYTYAQDFGNSIAYGVQNLNSITICADLLFNDELVAYLGVLIGWDFGAYDCDEGCVTGVVQSCT